MLDLTTTHDEDRVTVVIEDVRLDAAIATRFKDRMREIVVAARKPVMIDMSNVLFMDSSGLGAMIAVHKAMPGGLPLELCRLSPNVLRVFLLTRMDSVFVIHPDQPVSEEKRA